MNLPDILITLLTELIRTAITYKIAQVFFTDDENDIIRYLAYGISFAATSAVYLLLHSPILNLCVTLACLLLIAFTYHSSDIKRRIAFGPIILSLSAILDTISVYMTGGMTDNAIYGQVQSFVSVMLYLLAYIIYRRISHGHIYKSMSVYEWISLIGILAVSILCLVVLVSDAGISSRTVIVISFALLLNDIVVYYLFSALSRRYMSEREALMLKEHMSRYEADLSAHLEQEDRLRAVRHDMKHHLLELKALAEASQYDEISEYISDMQLESSTDEPIDTGNQPVDSILGYMMRHAEGSGIRVISHITIPEDIIFPVYDLTVILGNLMDNAIENTLKSKDPCISIMMKYTMSCLLISISNTYDGAVNESGGKLLTTKSDTASHGIGLSSVRSVVERNHGELTIDYDKEMFTVKVMLYG